ncbi:hypothetical protein KFU94_58310, partial [Chloroflexi bacterium TSY]|nr:hypothetical protein [Chloroflexi bacterium TSY]
FVTFLTSSLFFYQKVKFNEPEFTFAGAENPYTADEFAQINWKGTLGTTYVQWVKPKGEVKEGLLTVDHDAIHGASGGGIFAIEPDGPVHIANNYLGYKPICIFTRCWYFNKSIGALNPWIGTP